MLYESDVLALGSAETGVGRKHFPSFVSHFSSSFVPRLPFCRPSILSMEKLCRLISSSILHCLTSGPAGDRSSVSGDELNTSTHSSSSESQSESSNEWKLSSWHCILVIGSISMFSFGTHIIILPSIYALVSVCN